jgi:hypothetical protein
MNQRQNHENTKERKPRNLDEAATAMKAAPPPLSRRPSYDDEDDLPLPIRQKRRRKKSNALLLWLLLGGGGGFLFLACVGGGVIAYLLFFAGPKITGQWELVDPPLNVGRIAIDFRADGTGMISGPAADVHFSYELKNQDPLLLEWKITRVDAKQLPFVNPAGLFLMRPPGRFPIMLNNQVNLPVAGITERFHVALKKDELKLTPQPGGIILTLRKVR